MSEPDAVVLVGATITSTEPDRWVGRANPNGPFRGMESTGRDPDTVRTRLGVAAWLSMCSGRVDPGIPLDQVATVRVIASTVDEPGTAWLPRLTPLPSAVA